jgi:hypothetical protein
MTQVVRIKSAAQTALDLVQREFRDYHPLVSLARLAHDPRVIDDPRLEIDVHKAILPYVAPKLASVEVTEVNPDDRRVVVTLFDEMQIEDGTYVQTTTPLEIEDSVQLVPLDS